MQLLCGSSQALNFRFELYGWGQRLVDLNSAISFHEFKNWKYSWPSNNEVVEDADPLRSQKASCNLKPTVSNHGSLQPWFHICRLNPSQFGQNCNVDHWKKSTSKRNRAIPACVVQGSAVFPGSRAGSQHVRMEWNFGKGWTNWLRSQSMTGEEEMALMTLIIIWKRCWSSRRV